MYVNSREQVGPYQNVNVLDEHGEALGMVFAADTEAGWYEEYVTTVSGRVAVVDRALLTRKVEGARFKLVDRHSGEVLAESK